MKKQIDQGHIISGLRSEKYPNNCCMGVVISASCDLANRKVSRVYYLSCLPFQDWILTKNGFQTAFAPYINQLFLNFKNYCEKYKLNYEVFKSFTDDEANIVISQHVEKQKEQAAFKEKFSMMKLALEADKNEKNRKKFISDNKKQCRSFMKIITEGKQRHYYFLPEVDYKENGDAAKGIIVDLQDIGWIPYSDVDRMFSPGIDTMILDNFEESDQEKLKERYWLEKINGTEDTYVDIEYKIKSPRREHMMQNFIQDFARIGLEDFIDDNLDRMVDVI